MKRFRMDVETVHHEMSGHGGDQIVRPVEDPNGAWCRYYPDEIVEHRMTLSDAKRMLRVSLDNSKAFVQFITRLRKKFASKGSLDELADLIEKRAGINVS